MTKYDLSDEQWRTVRSAIIEYYQLAGMGKERDSILKKLGLDVFKRHK